MTLIPIFFFLPGIICIYAIIRRPKLRNPDLLVSDLNISKKYILLKASNNLDSISLLSNNVITMSFWRYQWKIMNYVFYRTPGNIYSDSNSKVPKIGNGPFSEQWHRYLFTPPFIWLSLLHIFLHIYNVHCTSTANFLSNWCGETIELECLGFL